LVKLDEDGEGSTLRLPLLPKGHPRGEDPPEELLPTSSPCVRLKLTAPSPNKSELTASILRHELAPSILNSYLSSEPASIRSHSDSLRDHHQAQIHCLARKSVYFHTHTEATIRAVIRTIRNITSKGMFKLEITSEEHPPGAENHLELF
jgi:hypothetical protein